ncbi:MAG: hypothetical protein ACRDUA_26410, partial [Micromonosporaceae bacterium]
MSARQGVSVGGTAEAVQRPFGALLGDRAVGRGSMAGDPASATGDQGKAMVRGQDEPVLPAERTDLVPPVRELLAGGRWDVRLDTRWCAVRPPGHRQRTHGWLLHLSATPASAGAVLDRAVPVLREHGVAFRFAATTDTVRWLMGVDCEPSVSGRFLTVYPRDDTQA